MSWLQLLAVPQQIATSSLAGLLPAVVQDLKASQHLKSVFQFRYPLVLRCVCWVSFSQLGERLNYWSRLWWCRYLVFPCPAEGNVGVVRERRLSKVTLSHFSTWKKTDQGFVEIQLSRPESHTEHLSTFPRKSISTHDQVVEQVRGVSIICIPSKDSEEWVIRSCGRIL